MMMSLLFITMLALTASLLYQCGDCKIECSKYPLKSNEVILETSCLPGYYKENHCSNGTQTYIICQQCPKDYYTKINNTRPDCVRCDYCSDLYNQIIKIDCAPHHNRECDCKDDFYKEINRGQLNCKECSDCKNCSKCPTCRKCSCDIGNFLNKDGTCQSCVSNSCLDKSCEKFCKPVTTFPNAPWEVILGILPFVFLPGLTLCLYVACKKTKHCCPPKNIRAGEQSRIFPNQKIILIPEVEKIQKSTEITHAQTHLDEHLKNLINSDEENGMHEPMMWPAQVVYTIIKQIPVRRWKEFLRLLSISDDEMDRVEHEVKGSYLEQQYQMLRLWTQRNGVNLENIYSTLQYMDLSGCAEQLQNMLQQQPQVTMV